MPKINKFEVQYAKSNMATCRVCMAKIPKGALRVGHTQVDGPMLDNDAYAAAASAAEASSEDKRLAAMAGATRWHHFECFPRMKGSKWMNANLPDKPTALQGFSAVKKGDQKKLESLWKAMSKSMAPAPAGGKRKAGSAEDKSAKRAKQDAHAKISKLTSPQGVLAAKDWKQIMAVEGELSGASIAQLKQELEVNKQVRGGKRSELVQRVAEGRVLGRLPSCPKCEHGRIHWSRIGGWHSCPGFYDKETGVTRRCYFRAQTMKRGKWKLSGKDKGGGKTASKASTAQTSAKASKAKSMKATSMKAGRTTSKR